MRLYIVRWVNGKQPMVQWCESYEAALTLKDALEEKGFADVTIEEGEAWRGRRYTIEVTAEDIRRAGELVMARDAGDGPPLAESCPISLAAMRALQVERVETVDREDGCTLTVEGEGNMEPRVFELPEEASAFVWMFDEGRAVEPFSFVVEEAGATVTCCHCEEQVPAATAHLHQGKWIGDECCWDERLRASE